MTLACGLTLAPFLVHPNTLRARTRDTERERERERERCSNVNFKGAGKAAETKREGHRER
jgi:hypothetical protein